MRKYIFVVLILLFVGFNFAWAQEIDFFYSPTCPYCAKEKVFLKEIKETYPNIKIREFSVNEKENVVLLQEFYKNYQVPSRSHGLVPATFVGDSYFIGFNDNIGAKIEDCLDGDCGIESESESKERIKLPFIGEINPDKYSLPFLAVVLGFLDGFNFCSLGALILILGLVLALKSRRKILIFGSVFILTTTVVYGILIMLWYSIFSFLSSYLKIMEMLIGILGIAAGIYFFEQFLKFRKHGPTCEAEDGKKIISKFSLKFQKHIDARTSIFIVSGLVLIFAAIITIVEFPCSAAIPVIFAGILSRAQLSTFYYLFYIALFLIFYMLDEIIVFLIALFSMKLWISSNKSITWITLAEAIVLFALGLYYFFGFSAFL